MWEVMNAVSSQLDEDLLDKIINQENELRGVNNYYEFAQRHRGETKWIDEYLQIMDKALKIKKQGIDKSSLSDKVEIITWYTNRIFDYYGYNDRFELPVPVDSMKTIEKIMAGEEKPEYFRVRIKYSFINPILNNTVKLDEVFHFNMRGKCFSYETKNEQ
jgi:hypothetical protein